MEESLGGLDSVGESGEHAFADANTTIEVLKVLKHLRAHLPPKAHKLRDLVDNTLSKIDGSYKIVWKRGGDSYYRAMLHDGRKLWVVNLGGGLFKGGIDTTSNVNFGYISWRASSLKEAQRYLETAAGVGDCIVREDD